MGAGQSLIYKHGEIISDTHANILALATGNLLKFDTLYLINDNTDAEGGDVVLRPIATNRFSKTADYIPAFDNTQRWFCIYDFEAANILELRDEIGNVVIGNAAINSFIWGDSDVSGNYIDNPTSLTLTAVNVLRNNKFGKSTTITINSNGNIENNIIDIGSSFLITDTNASTVNFNNLVDEATLEVTLFGGNVENNNLISSGTIYIENTTLSVNCRHNTVNNGYLEIIETDAIVYSNIVDNSTLTCNNVTNSQIQLNTISDSSNLVMLLSNDNIVLENNSIRENSTLTVQSNNSVSFTKNKIDTNSSITLTNITGTPDISANTISNGSIVSLTTDGGDFIRNTLQDETALTVTNGAGIPISMKWNHFESAVVIVTNTNAAIEGNYCTFGNITIDDVTNTGGASYIGVNQVLGSGLDLQNCDAFTASNNFITSGSGITVSACVGTNISSNNVSNSSQITISNWTTANVTRNDLTANSDLLGSVASSGNVEFNTISNDSQMSFTSAINGNFRYNCLRADSNCTGGANAGVSHLRNIVAATNHAFGVAVNEVATRVND